MLRFNLQNVCCQLSQQQAEQGQRMLTRLQQQMEEEARSKQNLLINQLQIMTKINTELPGYSLEGGDIDAIIQKLQVNRKRLFQELNIIAKRIESLTQTLICLFQTINCVILNNLS